MEKEGATENNDNQSKLIARRELRQKKILENAKSRMEMLSGKNSRQYPTTGKVATTDEDSLDSEEFSDPEVAPNPIKTDFTTDESTMPENFENLLGFVLPNGSEQNVFLQLKVHFLLSVIIGYFCTIYLGHYSIFLPAGTCILLDTIHYCKNRELNPILNVIGTILGYDCSSAYQIYNAYSIFKKLVLDLSVVIFYFGILCYILQIASDQFAYLAQFK